MDAYSPAEWSDFFVAAAGASAALLGLVFVALSINLERILSVPWLPGRAAETIVLLSGALAGPLLGLVPQSSSSLGLELTCVAALVWATPVTIQLRGARGQEGQTRLITGVRVGTTQVATLPAVVAGATLLAEAGGGLYWLAAGIVISIMVAVANAWVLLIEILR